MIKGESSCWINKQKLCREKFQWQEEYFAISVSQSHVKRVREYIFRQKAHHQKKSFIQEYEFTEKPETLRTCEDAG